MEENNLKSKLTFQLEALLFQGNVKLCGFKFRHVTNSKGINLNAMGGMHLDSELRCNLKMYRKPGKYTEILYRFWEYSERVREFCYRYFTFL